MFGTIISYAALISGLVFGAIAPAFAAPAAGVLESISQPDGAIVRMRVQGDEYQHWVETEDGYTVDKKTDGFWYYVESYSTKGEKNTASAIFSDTPAHKEPPVHLKKHIKPPKVDGGALNTQPTSGTMASADIGPAAAGSIGSAAAGSVAVPDAAFYGVCGTSPAGSLQTTPSGKVLFILGDYDNQPGATTEQYWADLLSNKVAAYYRSVSFGQVDLIPAEESFGTTNNGVVGWVRAGPTHPNIRLKDTDPDRVREIIAASDPYVNFASFDTNHDGFIGSEELAIVLIVAGYEQSYTSQTPSIWAEANLVSNLSLDGVAVGNSSVTSTGLNTCGWAAFGELHLDHPATVGIAAHEMGHSLFGLPDLYHTPGMNNYDLMAYGYMGKSPTDTYYGETPVAPSAWTKYMLGWVDAAEAVGSTTFVAAGDPTATRTNTVRKVSTGLTNEFFLIENRQPVGYDLGLGNGSTNWGGLSIWHVDNKINGTYGEYGSFRILDLEEANAIDGGDINGVLWRSGAFNGSSTPNSATSAGLPTPVEVNNFSASGNVMSANINNTAPQPPGLAFLISPNGSIINTPTTTFSWNADPTATHYHLRLTPLSNAAQRYDPKLIKAYTPAEVGCPGGTGICSVASPLLANGTWRWELVTWANQGVNTTKGSATFDVNAPGLVLYTPQGDTYTTLPTYSWAANPYVTGYSLWVRVNGETTNRVSKYYTAAGAGCADGTGTCSVTLSTSLPYASMTWYVDADGPGYYIPPSSQTFRTLARPDLTTPPFSAPSTASAGSQASISFQILNQGNGSTGASFTVNAYLICTMGCSSRVLLGSVARPALAAGGTDNASIAITFPSNLAAFSRHKIELVADETNQILELNESNNSSPSSNLISITTGADLTITTVSGVPSTAAGGTIIPINAIVCNTGTGLAGPFGVEFVLSQDTSLDASDSYLTDSYHPNGLGAGSCLTASPPTAYPATLPPTLTAERYYVLTKVDTYNWIPETNESNNIKESVAIGTPPTVPTGLAASAVSATQINLTWNASTDNVAVTSYKVYRNGTGTPIATLGNVLSYSNTGLTSGNTYSYTVEACDAAGNCSARSSTASATTPDTVAPTAPTNLTAVVGVARVNLSWTASTDNVGVASYEIWRCAGNSCTNYALVSTSTTTSYSDLGLTGGTKYRYRVRAKDVAGNSSLYSSAIYATPTADTQAPTAPTNLIATAAGMTQINLTWNASTDNVGVTGYKIERCAGAGCTTFAQVGTSMTTSYSDSGLNSGFYYTYRVRAVDAANLNSGYSNIATARTNYDTIDPSATTGLIATPKSGTQIDLKWTPATDNVGVEGYDIERCTGAGCTPSSPRIATVTTTPYSNTGLSGLTTYCYRVRAYDSGGNTGGYSNTACATTLEATAPGAPTNLTAAPMSKNQINLAWTASTDNVGVTGYDIERCSGSTSCTPTALTTTTVNSFNNTGLAANTTYRYRVRAYDAAGNKSTYSSIVNATTFKN